MRWQDFKLSKIMMINHIRLGLFSLALGIVLSWPIKFNLTTVLQELPPFSCTWWRVLLMVFSVGSLSLILARKGFQFVAEYIGTIACLSVFYPFLFFIAGLPKEIGLKVILFMVGGYSVIVSVSGLIAITLLQIFNKKPITTTDCNQNRMK